MEWKITDDAQNAVVILSVEGTIVAHETARMAMEGISFAREMRRNRFLIDYTRAVVGDSTIDTYDFMMHLDALGIGHADRIAIVYSKDGQAHRFAENVATNRGWRYIRYFTNVEEATTWLLVMDA